MAVPYNRLVTHHGLSTKELKAAFDVSTIHKREKVKELTEMIRDRISQGVDRNRRDFRLYKAMDWAFDSPFMQVSFTQLRGLLDSKPDAQKVMDAVNSWGLSHLLSDRLDANGNCCNGPDGKPLKDINVPVFFHIFVPLCMAYITIRWAKLFQEFNQRPHFKYDPAQATLENRVRAELITQVIERQSMWFDYPADTKQTILQMLQYGLCINFPREAWFREEQENEKGDKVTIREGLRFTMPHPSRMYYDTFHRLSTLNSNTGCDHAGYWTLRRYRDIEAEPLYWNKDKIQIGASSWFDIGKSDFLQHVYPCAMKFPEVSSGGIASNDREAANASNYYTNGHRDNATLETNHFQRIIPKEHGLGSYEYPVWFRFVVGDESTILFAEPLAFDRIPTYCYDADFNRERLRSMTLEVMPFQDHVSNILTHWILATKQNLTNPIFVDKDQIPSSVLQDLRNLGLKQYSGNSWIPFSSAENYRSRTSERAAIHQPQLARHNTGQLVQLMNGVLGMLDRLLLFSPQETGQAASHEQTAAESRIVDKNMSTRIGHTATFVKDGQHAKKQAMYDASMAHADDSITANLSSAIVSDEEEFKKLTKKLGLTLDDGEDYNPNDPNRQRIVKAKKSAMALSEFAAVTEGADRIDMPGVADAMAKVFIAVAGNQVLVQSIGAPQLVELMNKIIVAAGLPQDFRIKGSAVDLNASLEDQQKQLADTLEQLATQVRELVDTKQKETLEIAAQQMQQVATEVTEGIGAAVAQIGVVDKAQQQEIDGLKAAMGQLAQVLDAAASQMAPIAAPPAGPPELGIVPPPMQPPIPMPVEAPMEPLAPVTLPG